MKQNDKNDAQKSTNQPIGPRHTYEDKPGQGRPTPGTGDRTSASPSKTPQTEHEPHTTEDPSRALPDFGDAEPSDPRHLETTGSDGGPQSDSGQAPGGGASSTLQG